MDDNNRNLILAMVLSALVMIGWYAFFAPPQPTVDPSAVPTATTTPATTPAAGAPVGTAAGTSPGTAPGVADAGSADPSRDAPRVAIDTPSLRGSISLAGGRIDDLLLTGYRETLDPASPFVRLLSPTAQLRVTQEGTAAAPATEPFTVQTSTGTIRGEPDGGGAGARAARLSSCPSPRSTSPSAAARRPAPSCSRSPRGSATIS